MKKVDISVTASASYGIYKHGPIYGDEKIVDENEIPGVFEVTVTSAILEEDCDTLDIDINDHCKIYGPEVTGKCIVKSKTLMKMGGTAGTPFAQETITYTGVL